MKPDELDAFVTDYFADWKALLADQTGRLVPDGDRPSDLLHDLITSEGDVEEAWPLILALIERAPDEEARSFVAAGPLEDLIRGHGDRFADRLIERGRGDARLREALTGVWGIEELNDPLRGRIIDLLTG